MNVHESPKMIEVNLACTFVACTFVITFSAVAMNCR